MTSEQAYIEGFVKRASEHGYTGEDAAEILKQAMRGQNAYSLINSVSKPAARRALTEGLSDASKYMQPAIPLKGSSEADVLADLVRKVKSGIKNPPVEYMDKALLQDINHTASSMMHPNTHFLHSDDLSKSTAVGKKLLGLENGEYLEHLYPDRLNHIPDAGSADSYISYLKRHRPELM
jgi:hypothetical protein